MPIVDIEGLGKIEFPDSMTPAQIERAIRNEILPMVANRVPSATVAGFPATPAGSANPFTKGTARADSNWKVGDRYRFRVIDLLTRQDTREGRGGTVKEVTDSEVHFGNGRVTDLLGNMIRNPRGNTFINNQVFAAEYSIGRKWTTIFRGVRPDSQEDEWTLDMRVVAREAVTVPAGTFDAFKVEGRGFMRDRGARIEVNYWIAPDRVRPCVVYEYIARRGVRFGRNERMELVEYRQRSRSDPAKRAHGASRVPAAVAFGPGLTPAGAR
jgi:hypothetical protein